MRGKLAFVLGAAVGYVLGTRAGRERYEQIKRGAERLWQTEPVQQGVGLVKDAVDERTDDLKAFAIRVGNDVFSNLAGAREKSDPFSTTAEAAEAKDSKPGSKSRGGSGATKSRSSTSGSSRSKSASGKGGSKSSGGSSGGKDRS